MHVAFIADRDQHHHDGVTAGTAGDGARRAGVHTQLGDADAVPQLRQRPTTAVISRPKTANRSPAIALASSSVGHINLPVGPKRSVLIAVGRLAALNQGRGRRLDEAGRSAHVDVRLVPWRPSRAPRGGRGQRVRGARANRPAMLASERMRTSTSSNAANRMISSR